MQKSFIDKLGWVVAIPNNKKATPYSEDRAINHQLWKAMFSNYSLPLTLTK